MGSNKIVFALLFVLLAVVDVFVASLTTNNKSLQQNSRARGYYSPSFGNELLQHRPAFTQTQILFAPGRTHNKSHIVTSLGSATIPSLATALAEINTFYQSFPVASAAITCGIKASAADIVAQQAEATPEHKENYDQISIASGSSTNVEGVQIEKRRNFAFLAYGALYQGVCQHVIFNEIFPLIFGNGHDIFTVASKVIFDSLVVSPFICLPVAYLVKSVVYQFSVEEAFERYRHDVTENGLLFKYWSFWVPAQSLTFSVVPPHLRIAFIALVSFFWLVVFSSVSSQTRDAAE